MKHENYEAIGKLIYGFHRHHSLVDRMLVLLGMNPAPEVELADKLVAVEVKLKELGEADEMQDARTAIQAFAAQMRTAGQLIERATTPQPPDSRAYTQQGSVLDAAADAAWARMMVAAQERRRNQAPPA